MSDGVGAQTFDNYDVLDRLTGQEITDDRKTWQYDYGPNHNRQIRTDGDGLNESYSYQPDTNRLIEIDKLLSVPPADFAIAWHDFRLSYPIIRTRRKKWPPIDRVRRLQA